MARNLVIYKGNLVTFKGNKVVIGAAGDPCCCGDLCGTDCNSLATSYTVAGHAAIVGTCPTCFAGSGPQWDGIVSGGGAGSNACSWFGSPPLNPISNCGATSVGPFGFFQGNLNLVTSADGTVCYWLLWILCCSDLGSTTLWVGTKLTGTTPVGTYNFQAGGDFNAGGSACCATGPATLTVS